MSAGDVEYARTVEGPGGSTEVAVRLRDLYDVHAELEATGRQGVCMKGAVCAGLIGPGSEEAVRAVLGDGADEEAVARAVFGGDTEPVATGVADTYLLRCTPLDAPGAEVEEMFAR